MKISKIYIDMDGVLADFERGVNEMCGIGTQDDEKMWEKIKSVDHFYRKLKPVFAAPEMAKALMRKYGDKCEILTGIPKPHREIDNAAEDKIAWTAENISEKIKVNVCLAEEKQNYCTGKDCILIDDRRKNISQWIAAGGTGILFEDVDDTLAAIDKIQFGDNKKAIPFAIQKVLEKYTDQDHTLTSNEIIELLNEEYNLYAERKAIERNIELLRNTFGKDIQHISKKGYYITDREFCESELRLIIDSIRSNESISAIETRDITRRLCEEFANKYFDDDFTVTTDGESSSKNRETAITVDVTGEAIKNENTIQFTIWGYDDRKHFVELGTYVFSPFQIVNRKGQYYLLGIYNDEPIDENGRQIIKSVEVAKIKNVKIAEDEYIRLDKKNAETLVNDTAKLLRVADLGYGSETEQIHFYIKSELIDKTYKYFGINNIMASMVRNTESCEASWLGDDIHNVIVKCEPDYFIKFFKRNFDDIYVTGNMYARCKEIAASFAKAAERYQ